MRVIVTALLAVLFVGPQAYGQWEQVPNDNIPRTSSGEPDLLAPAPRAADGKPDLSGVWLADGSLPPPGVNVVEAGQKFSRFQINMMADLEPGTVELKPGAMEIFNQRLASRGLDAPAANCKPSGVLQLNAGVLPYKIVQTSDLVLILYEEDTMFRQIFLDGRQTVEDPLPRWMGHSTGSWEDDELVVHTTGTITDVWLDALGHPHSEALRLTERFRRRDAGHLEIEVTVDDPEMYSQPFTYTITATVFPDDDLLEYFCSDNELSSAHYQ